MCGIGGLIGLHDEGGVVSRRMLAALRHRGPDDEGFAQPSATVSLVHTRLAIFDLTAAGHQPMRDHPAGARDPLWTVFNGEIYNFHELQRELGARGHTFHSRCDTEVILASYREWSEDAVRRWRGMFALCLVDPARSIAWLYRDRLGIKPLYMFRPEGGGLMFASEMRALLATGLVPRTIDRAALESFLAQGAVHGFESFIKGITMVRPGEMIGVDLASGRELKRVAYWEFPTEPASPATRGQAIEELREVANESIRLHLASDAPLGLFLSGGIDSTALLAMAAKRTDGRLKAVTIGFDAPEFDETAAAIETASDHSIEHLTARLRGEEVLANLDQALAAIDQPTVDGFNTFFVSRAARGLGLTVAVSGLGGDELFGGYATFADVPRALALRENPLAHAAVRLGAPFVRSRAALKMIEACRRPGDALAMYLLRRELFLPEERRVLMPLPEACDAVCGLKSELLDNGHRTSCELDGASRISFFEMNFYMRHMLLRDADAFSMAAALEYRVPLLDHRLVEAVLPLRAEWKQPDPRPKPLLLDLADGAVPRSVWQRAKRGFTFPWAEWMKPGRPLHEAARDAAHDNASWKDLGLAATGVIDTWERFDRGDRRVSALQILGFIVLRDFRARHGLSAA
jgi:asparagine synthase (glutamine-hydrolysing)